MPISLVLDHGQKYKRNPQDSTKNRPTDRRDVFEYIIEKGANINVAYEVSGGYGTVLAEIIKKKNQALVFSENESDVDYVSDLYDGYMKLLLGANPAIDIPENIHAVQSLVENMQRNTGMIKQLIDHGLSSRSLLLAGMNPHALQSLGCMIDFDINTLDYYGQNLATHKICDFVSEDDVVISYLDELKELGMDLDRVDGQGDSPLTVAIRNRSETNVLEYLLSIDVNPNSQNQNGNTPLIILIERQDVTLQERKRLAKLLLDKGADPLIPGSKASSALHAALKTCRTLVPMLRNYVGSFKATLANTLLFSGTKHFIALYNSKKDWDRKLLIEAFFIAISLRDKKAVDALLNSGIEQDDISGELAKWKTVNDAYYEISFLKFISSFAHELFIPIWKEVLSSDSRKNTRELSRESLKNCLGAPQGEALIKAIEDKSDRKKRLDKEITKKFCSSVQSLFRSLISQGIFAVDIDGSGWAPGDHGWEVADEKLEEYDLRKLGINRSDEAKVCYTDLKYYKKDCKRLTMCMIYYYASSEEDAENVAKKVVSESTQFGLKAAWSGDTARAIEISLMET